MRKLTKRFAETKATIAAVPAIAASSRSSHFAVQRQTQDDSGNPFSATQPRITAFQGWSTELAQAAQSDSSGQKLPTAIQQKMETAFDTDFSDVRVHQGHAAQSIGALAYTRGSHLHFAPGKYKPTTPIGQQLLAHELAHVMQQRSERITGSRVGNLTINTDPQLEHEADVLAAKAVRGEPVHRLAGNPTLTQQFRQGTQPVQCETDDELTDDELWLDPQDDVLDSRPEVRQNPNITFTEAYDLTKWNVPLRGEMELITEQNADQYKRYGLPNTLMDYRGRPIPAPNDQMWELFRQRKVSKIVIQGENDPTATQRVVFGTKEDRYTEYPEKYGFLGRRAIKNQKSWKTDQYEQRLKERNPRRGQFGGKNMKNLARMDEINEESGLRVKHAPSILMINRYIKTQEDFIKTYLSGAKGTGNGTARPDHVTDHEIYRMFRGKHSDRILANTLFADDTLVIEKIGKRENRWWNKNQISRRWRIFNQN